jgi:hypothetical protein
MMKQAVEDHAGGRDIAEQFAPFFDGSIGGHHGGTVLVTAHDDFQKDLAAFCGRILSPISSINVEVHARDVEAGSRGETLTQHY